MKALALSFCALLGACAGIQREGIALSSLESDAAAHAALDRVPAAMLRSRVVMLGEPDHYVHEKYRYQLLFVRYLFEKGWRQIGFEMGRTGGKRLQRYLESGDEKWLPGNDPAATGRPAPTGILAFDPRAEWLLNDRRERARFMRVLRALNETRPRGTSPLHVFGFDVDFFATEGYAEVDALIGTDPTLAPIVGVLAEARDADELTQALQVDRASAWLVSQRDVVVASLGEARTNELTASLRCLADSLRFNAVSLHEPSADALDAAYAIREHTMFRQMDERLRDTNDKIVLIGHNMHLSKASSSIRFGIDRPMWPSVGTYLANQLGDRAFGVWMLYARGEHGAVKCRDRGCVVAPPADIVEGTLAKLGPLRMFVVDRRHRRPTSWFESVRFIQNGQLGTGALGAQADLIVFVEEVHAPQP